MNRAEMVELIERETEQVLELNRSKGKDYAGDEDALSNFTSAAERLGLTPFQVWAVYADKHWSAIMAYCREGKVESEPIEGRIRDVIVYGFLLMGLVRDRMSGVTVAPAQSVLTECSFPGCPLPMDHEGPHRTDANMRELGCPEPGCALAPCHSGPHLDREGEHVS